MDAQVQNFVQILAVALIPGLFAITVHEVAHGWMARQLGDRTAEMMGRLTLNPARHIDPLGTILVPVAMVWFTGFIFGWAKPVPVSPRNLRDPRTGMMLVAVAGPAANILMALGWAIVLGAAQAMGGGLGSAASFIVNMSIFGIFINLLLAVFNLIPLPPLDGGRILRELVPPALGRRLDSVEPYGLIIIVLLLWLGALAPVLAIVRYLASFLM
ncbi:MAG: site-2 protease family protein [Chromatiales bacterium]|nr:site-2 protease family protein [Chromatiales bacterium]